MMAKLIDELVIVNLASTFVQHYASISTAFLSINPKTCGELLPMALRTQVHPQHHDPTLMSIVTTQNLRSTTTKPKSQPTVMLLKTQTQINHAPPPQIKTQTHIATSHPWLFHCRNCDPKLPPI